MILYIVGVYRQALSNQSIIENKMKTNFELKEGFHAIVDNNRGHQVSVDLPESLGGTDLGAKAFELLAMSLNGCIGTIFTIMARKMHISFDSLRVEMETQEESGTIDAVGYRLYIKTDASEEKIAKCLDLTEKTCPVGMLFHKAGVPFARQIVME